MINPLSLSPIHLFHVSKLIMFNHPLVTLLKSERYQQNYSWRYHSLTRINPSIKKDSWSNEANHIIHFHSHKMRHILAHITSTPLISRNIVQSFNMNSLSQLNIKLYSTKKIRKKSASSPPTTSSLKANCDRLAPSTVLRQKEKIPALIYDEDLENMNELSPSLTDEYVIDVTEETRRSNDIKIDPHRVEQILRQHLPPDLVEEGILKHRRLLKAIQDKTLTQQDIENSAIVDGLDEIISNNHLQYPIRLSQDDRQVPTKMSTVISSIKKNKKSTFKSRLDSPTRILKKQSQLLSDSEYHAGQDQHVFHKGISPKITSQDDRDVVVAAVGQRLENQPFGKNLFHHHRLENELKSNPSTRKSTTAKSKIKPIGAKEPSTKSSRLPLNAVLMEMRELMSDEKWEDAYKVCLVAGHDYVQPAVFLEFALKAEKSQQYDFASKAAIQGYNWDNHNLETNLILARTLSSNITDETEDREEKLLMAQKHVNLALATRPDWYDVIAIKAKILTLRGKYKIAVNYYKKSVELLDLNKIDQHARILIYKDYAIALAGKGNYKRCEKYLKAVLSIDQNNVEAMSLLGQLYTECLDDLESAVTWYKKAAQLDVNDMKKLVRLAQVLSDSRYSGYDLSLAFKCYERAMSLSPQNDLFFELGWISLHLGDFQKAIQCLERSYQYDPDPNRRWTSLVLLGEAFAFDTQGQGSIEKAISFYQLALKEKYDYNLKLNLCKCLIRHGQVEEAEKMLLELRTESSCEIEVRGLLADLYHLTGRAIEAIREVDLAIEVNATDPMMQFLKGKFLYDARQFDECVTYLDRAVQSLQLSDSNISSSNPLPLANNGGNSNFAPEAYTMLGKSFHQLNRLDDAKKYLELVSTMDDELPTVYSSLGEVYEELGDVDQAIVSLKKASVLDRFALRPNFHLGNIYADRQQYEQAIGYYQKVLDNLNKRADEGQVNPTEREEMIFDDSDCYELVFKVYNNMAASYNHLGLLERSKASEYQKLATRYLKLASEIEPLMANSSTN